MVDSKRLFEVKSATIQNFDALWQRNFESNKNRILRTPGVTSLFGKFRKVPAIVVGAGPSLEKNRQWLQPAQDRAIIICADTILRSLDMQGVKPTITISLDPQEEIKFLFTGVDTTRMTLIAPTIINPEALEAWRGQVVFYNKYAPDIGSLTAIAQSNPGTGYLIPGGTVLSVALDLAFRMEADPIAFIGQDLSYPPGAAYSAGTVYGDSGYEELFERSMEDMVTDIDIFGRELPTKKSLFVTKQWMEWAFTTWKRATPASFYNCTEGGIVSRACKIATLEEWAVRFLKKKMNFNWALQKALGAKR